MKSVKKIVNDNIKNRADIIIEEYCSDYELRGAWLGTYEIVWRNLWNTVYIDLYTKLYGFKR
jgi:hypothetical protein